MRVRLLSVAAIIVLASGCATGTGRSSPPGSGQDVTPVAAAERARPLGKRLSLTKVALPTGFAYREPGYNGLGSSTRIGVAARANGQVLLAWPAKNGSLHVTPLSAALVRGGSDAVVPGGREVGGLVAHPNGFAVLTRRPDTNKWGETAAYLIRYRGNTQTFARKLSGTATQDTSPVLNGALAWNGKRYGAYFTVHGAGGGADGHFGDKLTYTSGTGAKLSGGWNWGCSHNEGSALLPSASGAFPSLCFEDWRSGLFVSTGIGAPNNAPVLQREECWAGYCGGSFGGFVKSSSGRFAAVFASRGASSVKPDGTGRGYLVKAAYPAHQVAVAFLKNKTTPSGRTIFLSRNPKVDHITVKAAPYGPNRILISWQNVTGAQCKAGTCTGRYAGTYLRLIDYQGRFAGPATAVPAQIAGDIAVLPNGDLVWAYVAAKPSYTGPLGARPASRTLTVARLAYEAG
jgi:hypothetical protein